MNTRLGYPFSNDNDIKVITKEKHTGHHVTAKCDLCSEEHRMEMMGRTWAEIDELGMKTKDMFIRHGWVIDGSVIFCPRCAERVRKAVL